MNVARWIGVAAAAGVMVAAAAARGQTRETHIGYAYPAGGQAGTTFEVTVGGQFLEGLSEAYVSGEGVTAAVVEYVKPLTNVQALVLRDRLKELQDKRRAARADGPATRPWTADDEREVAEVTKKLSTFVRKPSSAAIAETATLRVTVAKDAAVGERELRVRGNLGVSNPVVFCVAQYPEVTPPAVKHAGEPVRSVAKDETVVPSLPAVVNGQVMAGGVDRIRFSARAGQRVVVAVAARQLVPYLADAVPGWFQATIAVFDGSGREVAYADDFRFSPDPVVCCVIPRDGEYAVEIKDAIYRGREDFVYRVTIGEVPWVTGAFPLGGRRGEKVDVELAGYNLTAIKVRQNLEAAAAGVASVVGHKGRWVSNAAAFAVDELPEVMEAEGQAAQAVAMPVIVNGRIGKAGDRDVFGIQGKKGERVVVEVWARRLGSPVDSVVKVTDAAGGVVAENDDCDDKGAGLITHQADSCVVAELPADGVHFVEIADAQGKGGPEYGYRLRVSAPRPDFELRVVPSAINARAGGTVPVTVYAIRRDGFAGEIKLALDGAPAGYKLSGGTIPAGKEQVRVTLTAPAGAAEDVVKLNVSGRAEAGGKELVRAAVPADDMMQAFLPRHLVAAKELVVHGSARGMYRNVLRVIDGSPVKIAAGGTAAVRVAAPTTLPVGRLKFELSEPPAGISLASAVPVRGGTELVFACDATKAAAGAKGSLIVNVVATRAGAGKSKGAVRDVAVGALPAISFEVVEKSNAEAANAK